MFPIGIVGSRRKALLRISSGLSTKRMGLRCRPDREPTHGASARPSDASPRTCRARAGNAGLSGQTPRRSEALKLVDHSVFGLGAASHPRRIAQLGAVVRAGAPAAMRRGLNLHTVAGGTLRMTNFTSLASTPSLRAGIGGTGE